MPTNKIRLNVLGISYSENPSRGYVLVLGEQQGRRRIPIVIGAMEAQAIALQIERFSPPRPLTHDLFFQFARTFGIEILEINIVGLEEGVFFSEMLCFNGEKEIIIEARTSDAVALALRFHCPIFTVEEIIQRAGVIMDEQAEKEGEEEEEENNEHSLKNKTMEELNLILKDAVDNEDYELASKVRDEIKQRADTEK